MIIKPMVFCALLISAQTFLAWADQMPDLTDSPECEKAEPPQNIKFNDAFFEEIAKGKKVATTRKGVRCFRAGSIIEMQNTKGQTLGHLRVKQVLELRFSDITLAHAKMENCTVSELKEGLIEIYGEEIKTLPLSFVEFIYIKK